MQKILVALIIIASVLYLVRTLVKSLRAQNKDKGHCSGCGKE